MPPTVLQRVACARHGSSFLRPSNLRLARRSLAAGLRLARSGERRRPVRVAADGRRSGAPRPPRRRETSPRRSAPSAGARTGHAGVRGDGDRPQALERRLPRPHRRRVRRLPRARRSDRRRTAADRRADRPGTGRGRDAPGVAVGAADGARSPVAPGAQPVDAGGALSRGFAGPGAARPAGGSAHSGGRTPPDRRTWSRPGAGAGGPARRVARSAGGWSAGGGGNARAADVGSSRRGARRAPGARASFHGSRSGSARAEAPASPRGGGPWRGGGELLFEDARGGADPVDAELLAVQVADAASNLRVVVLNACESARGAQSAAIDRGPDGGRELSRRSLPGDAVGQCGRGVGRSRGTGRGRHATRDQRPGRDRALPGPLPKPRPRKLDRPGRRGRAPGDLSDDSRLVGMGDPGAVPEERGRAGVRAAGGVPPAGRGAPGAPSRSRRWPRWRRWLAIVGAAAILAVGGILVQRVGDRPNEKEATPAAAAPASEPAGEEPGRGADAVPPDGSEAAGGREAGPAGHGADHDAGPISPLRTLSSGEHFTADDGDVVIAVDFFRVQGEELGRVTVAGPDGPVDRHPLAGPGTSPSTRRAARCQIQVTAVDFAEHTVTLRVVFPLIASRHAADRAHPFRDLPGDPRRPGSGRPPHGIPPDETLCAPGRRPRRQYSPSPPSRWRRRSAPRCRRDRMPRSRRRRSSTRSATSTGR